MAGLLKTPSGTRRVSAGDALAGGPVLQRYRSPQGRPKLLVPIVPCYCRASECGRPGGACADQVEALLHTLGTVVILPPPARQTWQLSSRCREWLDYGLRSCRSGPAAGRARLSDVTHGSGVAPVTKQSGKRRQVVMRRGCNPRLRYALYHMAHCVAQRDAYFASLYTALKTKGQSHGRALRSIGDRLLRM